VPLHRQFRQLKDLVLPVLPGLTVGAVVSVGSGILVVKWLGDDATLSRTMAPKANTTPVSIAPGGDTRR
jgi:putative effector of murein hydrolase